MSSERLKTNLSGFILDNPIIPASGTFGFGYEFNDYYDINILGSISIKGTTIQERFGNPCPRIAETASGLLNAVGLQNPGARAVVEEELKKLAKIYRKKVIANISGFSLEDYVEASKILNQAEEVAILEINISCPNVHGGGLSFGTSSKLAAEVTESVKKVTTKPVYMKLSPNVTDIVSIAKACEAAGADGISLINTLMGLRLDLRKRKPILANRTGGLSGPAIFPLALRMIYDVRTKTDLPIIGMGGVSSADDAIEILMAGANAVQVGAANLINPLACKEIIENLEKALDKYNLSSVEETIGIANPEYLKRKNNRA